MSPTHRASLPLLGLLPILFLFSLPTVSYAAFSFNLDGTLDKPTISRAYFEGDFARILPPLEAWRQAISPKPNKPKETVESMQAGFVARKLHSHPKTGIRS